MKKIILILLALTLVSCGCPKGYEYDCNTGRCSPIVVVDTTSIHSDIEHEVINNTIVNEASPIPLNTKFKISDLVCAWGEKSGVVINIHWGNVPKGHDKVLVYTVQYPMDDSGEQEFYESELEIGKCK